MLSISFYYIATVINQYNSFCRNTSGEINDVTLTEKEVIDTFYGDTQIRIDEIHNTNEIIQPLNGGKGYYVSNQGDDKN